MRETYLRGFSWDYSFRITKGIYAALGIRRGMKIVFEVHKRNDQWGCI